jgi:hypothetical protein
MRYSTRLNPTDRRPDQQLLPRVVFLGVMLAVTSAVAVSFPEELSLGLKDYSSHLLESSAEPNSDLPYDRGFPASKPGIKPRSSLESLWQKPIALTLREPVNATVPKPGLFQGFLMDLARAERKRDLADLSTPVNRRMDLDNLLSYPGTDQVQAIILLRLRF